MHLRRGDSPPHFTVPAGQTRFAKQTNTQAVRLYTSLAVNAAFRSVYFRTEDILNIPNQPDCDRQLSVTYFLFRFPLFVCLYTMALLQDHRLRCHRRLSPDVRL